MKRIGIIGTGHSPSGSDAVPEQIAEIVSHGFDARLVEPHLGILPSTPEARALTEEAYIEIGVASAKAGFDALFINTVGDYGLWPLRAQLDIPVVGAGEAACRLAASLGKRFSIVTIWPSSMAFIYEQVLRDSGATERCANIHYLTQPPDLETLGDEENFLTNMRACHAASIHSIEAACREALENDGAEVIVLGCTCMAPTYGILQQKLGGAKIIEPMTAGYRYTELLASIR
jgi:allantoin racemase